MTAILAGSRQWSIRELVGGLLALRDQCPARGPGRRQFANHIRRRSEHQAQKTWNRHCVARPRVLSSTMTASTSTDPGAPATAPDALALVLMHNRIQDYDWGSTSALARLQKRMPDG